LAPFCWGLLFVTAEKAKAIEKSYSDARSLFSGDSYCNNRDCVFMFDYDTKEKEHQNTRKSDTLGQRPLVKIR
jgi:hypothetical protein